MKRKCSQLFGLLFLGLMGFVQIDVAQAAGVTTPVVIQPHRALYDVSLTAVRSGGQLVDIRGRMFFEWKKTCESWTTDHKSSLVYEYSDGTAMRMNAGFAAYETLDGKALNFTSKLERNGTMVEELRGHALLEGSEGAVGGVEYSIPQNVKQNLPQNTFFPMRHTIEMIARAKAGEKFFNAVLFDGSDDKGAQQVSAFIGETVDAAALVGARRGVDVSLLKVPARRVRLAFFDQDGQESAADHEMDAVSLDNGVVSDVKIIYDNFTVRQNLVALEKIPMPVCAEASSY